MFRDKISPAHKHRCKNTQTNLQIDAQKYRQKHKQTNNINLHKTNLHTNKGI